MPLAQSNLEARAPAPADIGAARELLERPLLELVFEAAVVHRRHHDPVRIQCSQLSNIKAGGCPEDCKYCSQSAHFETGLERRPLSPIEEVVQQAHRAKANGADRFCMGAAWREVRDGKEFEAVLEMVRRVRSLGLETCATLGMLTPHQAQRLKEAGLDYYNHNLDTGASFYGEIVTSRGQEERLETLSAVREAGIAVCCGGILGMGESRLHRAELLAQLAALSPPPESVPINALVPIPGTPLGHVPPLDWTEIVRAVAAARILMPKAVIRLSAGRAKLDEAAQALCFLSGANSIFVGEELLTTENSAPDSDVAMLARLGLRAASSLELRRGE